MSNTYESQINLENLEGPFGNDIFILRLVKGLREAGISCMTKASTTSAIARIEEGQPFPRDWEPVLGTEGFTYVAPLSVDGYGR